MVQQCARAYTENPRPRKLGKLYAFWYNGKNEPRIVVGPDFGFSLLELLIVNGLVGMVLKGAVSSDQWNIFYAGLAVLLSHNLSFLATVMVNQGLPPRNPNAHSKGYLNKVKTFE